MVFLLLVLGMVLLMKGADLFVDGSASVARKLKVPSVIIGLTIVALGTSLPEASVSITAGLWAVMKLRFQILWVLIFSILWLWLEQVQSLLHF